MHGPACRRRQQLIDQRLRQRDGFIAAATIDQDDFVALRPQRLQLPQDVPDTAGFVECRYNDR